MSHLKSSMFVAVLAASTLPAVWRAASAEPFALKSVSVELPASDRGFPQGPGAETVGENCVTCHSAGMILNQPALSKATWESEVHKMTSVYKAPVSPEDALIIVDYLALNLRK